MSDGDQRVYYPLLLLTRCLTLGLHLALIGAHVGDADLV